MHQCGAHDRVCLASCLPQASGIRDVAPHGLNASPLQLPGRVVGAREPRDLVAGGDPEPVYPVAPVISKSMPLLPAASIDATTLPWRQPIPPVVLMEGGYRITLCRGRQSYPVHERSSDA